MFLAPQDASLSRSTLPLPAPVSVSLHTGAAERELHCRRGRRRPSYEHRLRSAENGRDRHFGVAACLRNERKLARVAGSQFHRVAVALGDLKKGDRTEREYGNDPDTCSHQKERSFDRVCGVLNGSGKVLAPSRAVPAIVWRQIGGDEEEQIKPIKKIEQVPVRSARTRVR